MVVVLTNIEVLATNILYLYRCTNTSTHSAPSAVTLISARESHCWMENQQLLTLSPFLFLLFSPNVPRSSPALALLPLALSLCSAFPPSVSANLDLCCFPHPSLFIPMSRLPLYHLSARFSPQLSAVIHPLSFLHFSTSSSCLFLLLSCTSI